MKKNIINTLVILIVSVLCVSVAQAQQVRVALKGDAYVIKEGKYVALEVGGKIVIGFDEEYTEIITSTGKYFAARFGKDDSDWYIHDRNGEEVELGGGSYGSSFDKVSMVDGTIIIENKGKKHYFSESDITKAIQVQTAGADFFDKGRDFNPEKMTRDKAASQSEALSAQVAEHGRFEIRQKANSQRQELVVDGKVLLECQEFTIVSDAEYFNKTTCHAFIVKNNGLYGTFLISLYMKDGKKMVESKQFVPYEYTFMRPDPDQKGIVIGTTKSSTRHFMSFTGQRVQ